MPFNTEKRWNKAKYLTWNLVKRNLVNKSQTLPKALDIWSATAWVVPDLLKALAILSEKTFRRSAVDQEDLKSYWKSEK